MGNGIYDIIFQLYANQAGIASGYAKLIQPYVLAGAGTGALIYIFARLITQITSNGEIDFIPFLRPFAIMLLIPASPRICTALDNFGDQVRSIITVENTNVADLVKAQTVLIQKKVDEKWAKVGSDPEYYKAVMGTDRSEDEAKFFGDVRIDLRMTFKKFQDEFKHQLLSFVQSILLSIMHIAECALLLISIAFRVVLRIGFPITVALSIFPGFSQSLATWFGKYLNFALLPAVAAMYSSIAFNLSNAYINNYDVDTAVSSLGVEAQQPEFLGLAFIGLMVMLLIGYTQVPSMTAMLVSVGGVGQIVQAATRNLQAAPARAVNAGKTANSAGATGGRAAASVARGSANAAATVAKAAVVGGAAVIGAGMAAVNYSKGNGASRSGSMSAGSKPFSKSPSSNASFVRDADTASNRPVQSSFSGSLISPNSNNSQSSNNMSNTNKPNVTPFQKKFTPVSGPTPPSGPKGPTPPKDPKVKGPTGPSVKGPIGPKGPGSFKKRKK
jgi:hypothetical protein